jgi:hypothetical protein
VGNQRLTWRRLTIGAGAMFAAERDVARGHPGLTESEYQRRTPIFIICSSRPRVGRTLIARLLTEYFLADNRRVVAFDVNPDDPVFSDHLPAHAVPADVTGIEGQMALFDRLIVNDETPKVIDLANSQFGRFFDLCEQIDFVSEARARAIDLAALFITDDHTRSSLAFGELRRRFEGITLVEVHNEGVRRGYRSDFLKLPGAGNIEMTIARLLPESIVAIEKPGFSFAGYLRKPPIYRTELDAWISGGFIAFRDLELRLSLEEFGRLLRR